jgi:DeoR family suf operon transcriptional repressor
MGSGSTPRRFEQTTLVELGVRWTAVEPVVSTVDVLPTARRALLTAIKRDGEARADDLAAELGITASAIRQHLQALERDGLVEHREVRGGPGRPKHVFGLTPRADALFPRAYGELTGELLGYVAEDEPGAVERAFDRRRARRVADAKARLAAQPDLDGRVRELARILDEDGYLAEAQPDPEGGWRIIEHNCAILSVALRYGVACGTELDFLREVLPETRIDRVSHMVQGAHHCAYTVRPI